MSTKECEAVGPEQNAIFYNLKEGLCNLFLHGISANNFELLSRILIMQKDSGEDTCGRPDQLSPLISRPFGHICKL